jgi:hypothetical protein
MSIKFTYPVMGRSNDGMLTFWQVRDVNGQPIGIVTGHGRSWAATTRIGWSEVQEWHLALPQRNDFPSKREAALWLAGVADARSQWFKDARKGDI